MLEPFFNGYDDTYSELRTRCRDILQQEDSLSEIVQLVGRDSLSEDQKVRGAPPARRTARVVRLTSRFFRA